jgi:CubicO group peptidase (beta-lactamase class C family)
MQILLVYVALLLPACTPLVAQGLPRGRPEDAGLSSSRLNQVILALGPYVRDQQIPGALVAVARHGKLVYLDSIGMRDTERGLPMHADVMFRIYSMTKPITTVALAQLVERGRLRFDDPVSRFIPSFGSVRVYAGGPSSQPSLVVPERPMTIEDLLRHTSGLVYGIGLSPVDSIYRRAGRCFSHLVPDGTTAFQPMCSEELSKRLREGVSTSTWSRRCYCPWECARRAFTYCREPSSEWRSSTPGGRMERWYRGLVPGSGLTMTPPAYSLRAGLAWCLPRTTTCALPRCC